MHVFEYVLKTYRDLLRRCQFAPKLNLGGAFRQDVRVFEWFRGCGGLVFCCQFAPKLVLERAFRQDVRVFEYVLKRVEILYFVVSLH